MGRSKTPYHILRVKDKTLRDKDILQVLRSKKTGKWLRTLISNSTAVRKALWCDFVYNTIQVTKWPAEQFSEIFTKLLTFYKSLH